MLELAPASSRSCLTCALLSPVRRDRCRGGDALRRLEVLGQPCRARKRSCPPFTTWQRSLLRFGWGGFAGVELSKSLVNLTVLPAAAFAPHPIRRRKSTRLRGELQGPLPSIRVTAANGRRAATAAIAEGQRWPAIELRCRGRAPEPAAVVGHHWSVMNKLLQPRPGIAVLEAAASVVTQIWPRTARGHVHDARQVGHGMDRLKQPDGWA